MIQQINVLGSSVCNLKCSYCYLHMKKEGDAYSLLNKEIKEGWKTGSYVANIKKIFQKLNENPKEVMRFEIWGGEPLIQIQDMVCSAADLFSYFSELNFLLIPTNWSWNSLKIIENIIEYLKIADENISPRAKNERLEFHLQLSIDGPPGPFNENGHKGLWDTYRNNIITFCECIAKIKLNNVNVRFEVHPTASGELIINNFKNHQDILAYHNYMQDFLIFIREQISKNNISDFVACGDNPVYPMLAVPERSSIESSMDFLKTIILTEYAQAIGDAHLDFTRHLYQEGTRCHFHKNIIDRNTQCIDATTSSLMIIPDGTICECACSYIQTHPEYLENMRNNESLQEEYRVSKMREQYFYNPLTISKEQQEQIDWYIHKGLRDTYTVEISLAMALCRELALSRQINIKYFLDPELLLKHLSGAPGVYNCTREAIRETKVPFLSQATDCRRYFNGLTDFASGQRLAEAKMLLESETKCN